MSFSKLNQPIELFIDSLNLELITKDRKIVLQTLIDYITKNRINDGIVKLNFICTHNSRRSHMCQVWAKTLANYYNIENIKCYSGGTEATAVYSSVLQTLKNAGFRVNKISETTNPTYKLNFNQEDCPMTLFSKTYNDAYNPREDFAAVMTCTDADINCPIIPMATRISLPYKDPREYDHTSQEQEAYADRSKQIATEMKFVFLKIKNETD